MGLADLGLWKIMVLIIVNGVKYVIGSGQMDDDVAK
jgi:hypothetical protein